MKKDERENLKKAWEAYTKKAYGAIQSIAADGLPKPPKYTKEQKVVLKALEYLAIARCSAKIDNGDFEYARGLLESLVIQYD